MSAVFPSLGSASKTGSGSFQTTLILAFFFFFKVDLFWNFLFSILRIEPRTSSLLGRHSMDVLHG